MQKIFNLAIIKYFLYSLTILDISICPDSSVGRAVD